MQKNDSNHNNNEQNGEVIHLGDHVFRKTQMGLDEKEVRSYIEELLNERDTLIERQEHLSALSQLAEKTIIEANNLSLQMKKKATDQAKVEADKIKVKAEQDAEQIFTQKKAEADKILMKAEQDSKQIFMQKKAEADKILIKGQEDVEQLLKVKKIEADKILTKAQEDVEQLLKVKKTEADKILTKAEQEAEQLLKQKKAEAKAVAEKEAEAIRAEVLKHVESAREEQLNVLKAEAKVLAQRVQTELLASVDNIKKQIMSIGTSFENVSLENDVSPLAKLEEADTVTDTLSVGEKGALLDHIPWIEVEVMPPLDIEKIMELISRLETLPQVKTTDLLPETPNPLIRVFLNEPAPLAELMRAIPQVEKVIEKPDFGTSDEYDIQPDDKRERIQIVLGSNPNKETGAKKNSTVKTGS
jgi:cell division septum initiation protein DivIVA